MKPYQRNDREGWWIRYKDSTGKWVTRKGGKTEREAYNSLQRAEDNVRMIKDGLITSGQLISAKESQRPIGDIISEYIEYLRSKKTTAYHRKEAKRCIVAVVSGINVKCLNDIQAKPVEKWLYSLTQKGRSARTHNIYLARITALINWAYKRGMLQENPLRVIEKLPEHVDRREISRSLTPDEFKTLIAKTPNDKRKLYYMVAGRTGLRWQEIKRLRWEQINFEKECIFLDAGKTKSKRGDILPLAPDLKGMLLVDRKRSGAIFTSSPILRTFKADLKRANISYVNIRGQVDRKSLRKMFGTHLAMNGVSLQVTQKLMRHSDPKLTMNIYTDAGLLNLKEAVNLLT